MASTNRLRRITEATRRSGELTVAELAELTGASEMTIRRDLETLADQGVLERFRGGARSLLLRGEEPPFLLRVTEATEAKQRIAADIANLIADGESVVLDSGTTCLQVAYALRDRKVTVMPLSLHAANALIGGTAKILMAGGEPRSGELALTGPLAEASLAALRFDTAIIGPCGLNTANGLTAHDLADAAIKRAAMASSRRLIAAADASKFTRTALAFVTPVTTLNAVVTEETAPQQEIDALTAAGVTVRTVP
ncbi:DeoR/GlpR family DNA-binding transcription regulator [Actinocrispum wychmicini]|nr:DeoR/GlpR family DNA-binding transcription regulator [Actinocrispum wychmicini]